MSSRIWQQFLTTQGAQFDAQGFASFAPAQSTSSLYDLSSLGLIAVSGEDAYTFLQGQFTNDIKQVGEAAQFTGYCTAKGRLLALFYAFSFDNTIYLQCPRPLIAAMVKRLRMYVLRSKVQVEDVSDAFVCLGLAASDLSSLGVSQNIHGLSTTMYGTLVRLPDSAGLQRAQWVVSATQAEAAWTQLCAQFTPASTNNWEALEIQAGVPQVYPSTQEQFVPQMLNLDALGGINFKKGCYTGQEIVARTHYLGKVKRRSLLASVRASDTSPQAGDKILDAQQQEAGQLVRVAANGSNGWWLLAECRLEARESGEIFWQGQALQFVDLPYVLA